MSLVQAAQAMATAEPIVVGGTIAATGGILWWAMRTLVAMRDDVKGIAVALYGDPNDPEPNGLKREVRAIRGDLTTHVNDQRIFNDSFTKALGEHHRLLDRNE